MLVIVHLAHDSIRCHRSFAQPGHAVSFAAVGSGWLPEDHLARFVVEIVDRLDLGALERRYGGGGKDPYHPSVLLGLLFYGYATGVFSSRKLERATYDSVAFRFIAANTHPDHDTIAGFRKRFLGELGGLFVQILSLAREICCGWAT